MKPSAVEAADKGARPSDGMQAKSEKIKSSLRNVKDTGKPEKLKYKPLTGKVFYLDIPSNVISEKIGKDLKELGGRVESFLSKDISYLVSNKKEAKFAPSLGQISPVPSPESAGNGGNSSPHPSNRKDRHDGSSFKIVDTVRMSRGKSLVEKAIKEQDLIPSGSILSNALSWGVKILHIDDVKNYIEQKKKELYLIKRAGSSSKDVGKQVTAQKPRTGRLKDPFVKVEDRSRLYRPFYLQLPIFPVLNYCVPKPYSPFEVDKKHPSGQKQMQSKQRTKVNSDKDCGTPVQLPQKDKKRRGYCECCGKKYEDLQTHLESEQHRNFAQSTQYQVVDDIISKFVYKFVEYKDDEKIKRTKCSTGCFSPTTGKISRPDELKERLKKQRISLKSYSWKDTTMGALRPDRQPVEIQPNSVPIPTPLSGSVCSVLYCHLAQPSELQIKFRNNDENTKTDCSCAANLRQTVVSSYFRQSPPRKDDKAYTETLSQAYESSNKEILQLEVNKKNLQCFQEGMCTLCSHAEVTEFSEKEKKPLQLKRKLNNAVVLPAKFLKKADANPTYVKKHHDFCDNHQQMQHNVVLEAEVSDTAINKELNELAASTTPSSPSGKLHRKVKLYLGRNKKETQKQNLELCVKYTNGLSVPEQKRSSCSSPVQALLELFQTSERNSEFGGFSGYTESKGTTSMKDIWEGQNTNFVLSLFSSSSSSPFVGF
ncbi:protein DBF4 homolog A isoform X1 [Neopsephotus bourkii]|uniref:protein DBF4 homolog A isoform X1 n=2 Tax=Neopsephotus bourkii TaxID=309878 RepID=UPI002AA56683|nr:protein DBF4 homolog A isoform X1 [Neopsephotus bourkii]XP_061202068.1 protein DBF4 homolog A isoform X1 [Neopsephotus bourkii]XP_061202069.1 protein DBF4 homolog A isoform X1 [Neopsephotus bourkii]